MIIKDLNLQKALLLQVVSLMINKISIVKQILWKNGEKRKALSAVNVEKEHSMILNNVRKIF